MNEHPFFARYRGDHVAAILTLPDREPTALVALLQGAGSPRSHRARVWTWLARDFADRGVATVRLDWRATGDSTGSYADRERPPSGETMASVDVALRATGLNRFGVVGACLGAKTGFALAANSSETCTSVACFLPDSGDILIDSRWIDAAARDRMSMRLRRRAWRAFGARGLPVRMRLRPEVESAIGRADVLLLTSGAPWLAAKLRHTTAKIAARSGQGQQVRTEVRYVQMREGRRTPVGWNPEAGPILIEWMEETLTTAPAVSLEDETAIPPSARVRSPR